MNIGYIHPPTNSPSLPPHVPFIIHFSSIFIMLIILYLIYILFLLYIYHIILSVQI